MHSDADVLRYGSDQVTLLGVYIELGIGVGRTVNFIAALNPTKKIMGLIHLKVCRKVGKGRI